MVLSWLKEQAGAAALAVALVSVAAGCASAGPAQSPPSMAGHRGAFDRAGYARAPSKKTQAEESTVTVGSAARADMDSDGVADAADIAPSGGAIAAKEPAPESAPAPPPPPPPAQPSKPQEAPRPEARREATGEEPVRTMMIYSARVTMAVYQVGTGLDAVERIAKEAGGFLSLRRDREITIRVPRAQFEAALAAVDRIGDVLHRDVEAQDVTDEYVDLEIRIKNARAMQRRLQQLLERAAVKEAIAIEKELHRVTEDLERLEGKLKLLKDKVAYSTITVAFEARGSAVAASRVRLPFPWLSQLGLPQLLNLNEVK